MTREVDRLEPSELEREIEACRAAIPKAALDQASPDVASLERAVEGDLDKEAGWLAILRSLSTARRVALVLIVAVAVTAATWSVRPRPDFGAYPGARMILSLALLASVTAAACWRLLRPLHAPPPAIWASRGLLVAGVLLPCALAAIPIDHAGAAPGEGMLFAIRCSQCAAFGGAMGFPVLLLAMLARRARVDGAAVAALAGVAAGLTGNLALQVHCPITDMGHLLAGHAVLVFLLGLVAACWRR